MAVTGNEPLHVPAVLGARGGLSIAEQATPATFLLPNQLSKHFLYYPYMDGTTIRVLRTDTPGTAAFMKNNLSAMDKTSADLQDPAVTVEATCIGKDVDLTEYIQTYGSYTADQLEYLIGMAKIAIRIAFWNQVFRPAAGDGFEGLPTLAVPAQTIPIGANGGPFNLDMLDDLCALVSEGDAEMSLRCLVMTRDSFKSYVRLVRAAGYKLPDTEIDGFRYAMHNGVPIFVCDYIPSDETLGTGTNLTSIYCMTLGYENKGLWGAVPPDVGENGLVTYRAQYGATQDTAIWRVKWYVTLILTQETGLARLEGVQN